MRPESWLHQLGGPRLSRGRRRAKEESQQERGGSRSVVWNSPSISDGLGVGRLAGSPGGGWAALVQGCGDKAGGRWERPSRAEWPGLRARGLLVREVTKMRSRALVGPADHGVVPETRSRKRSRCGEDAEASLGPEESRSSLLFAC